ncbi:Protein of unknown function [Gryllus bimaculatus]|nr:Protein of unknown function [Gryllus bimaculatus]
MVANNGLRANPSRRELKLSLVTHWAQHHRARNVFLREDTELGILVFIHETEYLAGTSNEAA